MDNVNRLFHILIIVSGLILSGCSSLNFFSSEDEDPPAELVEFEPALQVNTLWSRSVGKGSKKQQVKLEPFVYQGQVVVADRSGNVFALDQEDGERIWTADTELQLSGGPGVADGLVVLGTSDAEVIALDLFTGEQLWQVRVSSEVLSAPLIIDGVVVVHTIDGKIVGLSPSDGSLRWTYARSVPVLTLRGSSSPVAGDLKVITGLANGKLVALNPTNGNALWETSITSPSGRSELERMADIDGDPIVRDGVVFVTTYQGELAAVSEETGVVLWKRELSAYRGASADWRSLYITDAQDSVWAFDPRNGSAVWRQNKMRGRKLTAPAVLDEYIVVGDLNGYIHWLHHEDGRIVARNRISSHRISANPKVIGDTVYVYSSDGKIAALSVAKLEE